MSTHLQAYEPARLQPHSVSDSFHLTALHGAADLLLTDLQDLPGVHPHVDGPAEVRVDLSGPIHPVLRLPLFGDGYLALGRDANPTRRTGTALATIEQSRGDGLLGDLTPTPLRFRVTGAYAGQTSTLANELCTGLGWIRDQSRWDLSLDAQDAEWRLYIGALHWTTRFAPLERLPWSTSPIVAATLARLAKIRANDVVLDPCCGTGTVLIAANLTQPSAQLIGADSDELALEIARRNLLGHHLNDLLINGDAVSMCQASGSIDRVISNLPFGKLVGSHASNIAFYPALIAEIARVLAPRGRAVLLTEDKRLLVESVQRTRGLKIVRERVLRYGGATPTAFVISRTRVR